MYQSLANNSSNALSVVATIPVGVNPYGIAYDSGKGEVFVGNNNSNTGSVSVIRDSDNKVVTTIPVGQGIDAMAYDSGKGEVFVANFGDNSVSVINDTVNKIIIPSTNQATSATITNATPQDIQNINQAKASQTIAAEVNVGVGQSTTTSIDNNVSVQTTSNTPDSLNANVSTPNQTGPKIIVFNLNTTTINVANLKDLGVMYDRRLIQPAPNMDAVLHAKPTDSPSFAIVVTKWSAGVGSSPALFNS